MDDLSHGSFEQESKNSKRRGFIVKNTGNSKRVAQWINDPKQTWSKLDSIQTHRKEKNPKSFRDYPLNIEYFVTLANQANNNFYTAR